MGQGRPGPPAHHARRAVAEVWAKSAEEVIGFEVGQLSGLKQRCALLGWEALRKAILTGAGSQALLERLGDAGTRGSLASRVPVSSS